MIRRNRFIHMGRNPMSFRGWTDSDEEEYNPSQSEYQKLLRDWDTYENIRDIITWGVETGKLFLFPTDEDSGSEVYLDSEGTNPIMVDGSYYLYYDYDGDLTFADEDGKIFHFNDDDYLETLPGDTPGNETPLKNDPLWMKLVYSWINYKLHDFSKQRRNDIREGIAFRKQLIVMFSDEIRGSLNEVKGTITTDVLSFSIETGVRLERGPETSKIMDTVRNIFRKKGLVEKSGMVPFKIDTNAYHGVINIIIDNILSDTRYSIPEIMNEYEKFAEALGIIVNVDFAHIVSLYK